MNKLPFDILKRILDMVGNDGNDLLSLYYCSHVCVSWCNIINFYANYVSKDKDVTRCKITSRSLKFYSESEFLDQIALDENTNLDALLGQCVMLSIGDQLLRIQCIDFPVSESISGLIPENLIDFHLSHIHLEKVGIYNEIFEIFCSKFAPTLSHLYLNNHIADGKYFSIAAVTRSISKLINVRHLDLKDILLNESLNNEENCGAFLESLARNCSMIENLSINDYIPQSNEDLVEYLSSESTSHLRFLLVSSPKIDDKIEDGFTKRMELFKEKAPPLVVFAYGTKISGELSQKYLRPDLFGFQRADDEVENRVEDGKIYLDILPTPPFGSTDEYPFQRSNVSDWPRSPRDYDLQSSISGGDYGYPSCLDIDDVLDYDDDDQDEYDDYDDDYEYAGDEDFYG